jgi:hypothetical protein
MTSMQSGPRHQNLILELESQLAECELAGDLSADPQKRFDSKKTSDTLRAKLQILRQENAAKDSA